MFNLMIVLAASLFLRLYRLPELLGFWYDQGRDALVIWDLIHNGKLFLIGPMMGNTGIFRGPWYYYLITPAYYFSDGNPVAANYFLILISVFGLFVLYKVAVMFANKQVALMALIVASFSGYIIGASRWLSNPTPTLLTGVLFIYFCFKFLEKKWWALPLTALTIGMGLNFGAATEIYLIPALFLILFLNKKIIPNTKIVILSVVSFVFTFLPQIIFEVRHDFLMAKAFYNFIFNEKTFTLNFIETLNNRIVRYYDLFSSKFWPEGPMFFLPFFVLFVIILFTNFKKLWVDKKFKIVFITFVAPFVGTLFFVSNLGGFYDYYFTAYYFVFILFFVFVLSKSYKFVLYIFILVVLIKNFSAYKNSYFIDTNKPEAISFSNQIKAIDWIRNHAEGDDFNIDVYVPPVVPYAYDYLFKWKGLIQKDQKVKKLFTLYEIDPEHPERLKNWLERQKSIGIIIKSVRFGGIVVEERQRI